MRDPVDECGQCGEDLFLDVPHECPAGGNTVLITMKEDDPADRAAWIALGVEKGWCGPPVCSTHDGVPTTAEEDEAMEESDPCINVIRPYEDASVKDAVEQNHPPSVWRK